MSMHIRRSDLAFPIVTLLLAGLALPLAVAAHAELVTASPKDGDTVVGNPPEIHATYSENLNPDGSALGLYDPSNNRVARGGVVPDGGPKEMFIRNLPTLVPGVYTVQSTTRSADDGDIERVTWSFTVTAPAPSATPEPTTAPSTVAPTDNPTTPPSAAATPAATPSASARTGTSTNGTGDTTLPIIAALAIVAVAGVLLVTRGRRTPPVA
jgi:methionine-rich copper-binding protein CopC